MRYAAALKKLLALEYNCAPEDFDKTGNIVTASALNEGRRRYSKNRYFFHMVTLGGNAVITADERLHPYLRGFAADRVGHWLFELANLLPLEGELNRFGYTLGGTFHMFLPDGDALPQSAYPVKWYCGEEIHRFYGDARFPNAILPEYDPARPDVAAVCAMDGDRIMGMAGCSVDAPGWLQIGIDVAPEYRSCGVGTYLVTLLKNRILEMGHIPFYGTSASNYHSWNVALNSGFRPAWVEVGSKKRGG